MSLRGRLLLAQAPLALALALIGVVSSTTTRQLSREAHLILADNYRSVLAAQRMNDAVTRLHMGALRLAAGHEMNAGEERRLRDLFDRELAVQEGNVTEPGESQGTARLREGWDRYRSLYEKPRPAGLAPLERTFEEVRSRIDEILSINQDAMVRKSDRAEVRAESFERRLILAVVLSMLVGLFVSTWMIARALRPLGVVNAAVRRFGEGDLKARADVRGRDEIAAVAGEFNRMAGRLEQYRASSLGDLLQAQQAAQAAIDSLADPVLLLDATGALQGANSAASSLLSVDLEASSGDALSGVDPGVRALVERLRGHVMAGKGAYLAKGFEEAIRVSSRPDGERVFLPRGTPIYGENGTVGGAAIVFQDVTRMFRFDELRNDLVATVAHEFRTPLTSLRMAIHLCTEEVAGPLSPKQADLLFAAREDCERLQVIVDDLLNLSRIESGNIDLRRRRHDPAALVDTAIEVHRPAAEQAGVTIRREVLPGLPEVFVDPERLQLVFSNIVTNAIRFAPRGTEITIRAQPTFPAEAGAHRIAEASHIRFEVTDRGPGVPSEHQVGLFAKFFRVPGSPEGGSGLGLFIAKGIVQAHGGEIGIESIGGKGATFWFTVPVAPQSVP